jgi:hypothetical protein
MVAPVSGVKSVLVSQFFMLAVWSHEGGNESMSPAFRSCATVHDTFLHNLKPASKDSVFIPVDEWVLSSLYNRLSGPN